ncbi:hypothetical protein GCM10010275_34180 [Streptomyces litmocidini]|nr:hypothetical protein GCM10010275_34180 [Streptomyces litmocidini]
MCEVARSDPEMAGIVDGGVDAVMGTPGWSDESAGAGLDDHETKPIGSFRQPNRSVLTLN